MAEISVQELHKYFGEHHVLKGLSFDLQEGERASIVGPNGCGKTTLLNMLCGKIKPDSGSVETGALLAGVKGADLKKIETYANCIGLVFQIVDDILDVTASAKQLGKSNSDAENGKLTFVSLYGLEGSRKHAQLLIAKAQKALDGLKTARKKNLWPLYEMAEFFKTRTY